MLYAKILIFKIYYFSISCVVNQTFCVNWTIFIWNWTLSL